MSVAFDAVAMGQTNWGQSASTSSFTIGSGTGRVALVGLWFSRAVTNVSVTVGGQSGTQIGTDSGGNQGFLFGVINPASGSQTGSVTWTTPSKASIIVMTFSGAHDTTPFTNYSVDNWEEGTSKQVTITSTSGDLTASMLMPFSSIDGVSTNQTLKQAAPTGYMHALDIATAGTGTTTHTWTLSSQWAVLLGVNIVQAAATATFRPREALNR